MLSFHGQGVTTMQVNKGIGLPGTKQGVLIPVHLPTASHEFTVLEGMWHIAKRDRLALKYYPSFEESNIEPELIALENLLFFISAK
jgi:hypothetical protein